MSPPIVAAAGLSPSLRKEGWKFLLGLYPASSTAAERRGLAAARAAEYETLKAQWSTITPKQVGTSERVGCTPHGLPNGGPHERQIRVSFNFALGFNVLILRFCVGLGC